MSDEFATSGKRSTAFCPESVATSDTIWEPHLPEKIFTRFRWRYKANDMQWWIRCCSGNGLLLQLRRRTRCHESSLQELRDLEKTWALECLLSAFSGHGFLHRTRPLL